MSQNPASETIEQFPNGKANPVPILQIDWGIDPKPGLHLTPKFTIFGLDENSLPVIHFPPDKRIGSDSWNSVPVLDRNGNVWSFHQPLRLNEPGQYLLRLLLIDRVPDGICSPCYQAKLRVTVLPEEQNSSRTLEISAEGMLTANLPQLDKFDHVKINTTSNFLLNAPEESPLMRSLKGTLEKTQAKQNSLVVSIPFVRNEEFSRFIPYIMATPGEKISRIRLLIPNKPALKILAGSEFTFGRDVPEEKRINDIPLKIETSDLENPDEKENLEQVSRLFSREHAHLKWDSDGVWFFDDRMSGMDEGTIVNRQSLTRKQGVLLFPYHQKHHAAVTVLFAKMLKMELMPIYETLFPHRLVPFPEELQMLYGFDDAAEDKTSAVRIRRSKYFKQYKYVEPLKTALKEIGPSDPAWLDHWLKNRHFPDSLFGHEEYLLVHTFASLGGSRDNTISIPHRSWRDVQLRLLNIDNRLYLENSVSASLGITIVLEDEQPLRPFCRIPIQPGMMLKVEDSTLTFEYF